MVNTRCQQLRTLLRSECPLVMPDAYDALSARMIEIAGFRAVQCSGFGIALASGCKSEDELSLARNLQITQEIVRSVTVPVMADGEDGYGPPENVAATVKAFAEAGVSGINIEDQDLRSGGPRSIIDKRLMVEKVIAARRAAEEGNVPGLVINGRTDALAVSIDRGAGLKEAIDRANLYLDAGADLVFVSSVTTLDEAKTLAKEISGPLSIAAGLPGNIESMPLENLKTCGLARISIPTVAVFATIQAIKTSLNCISDQSGFNELQRLNLLCTMEDVVKLR